MPHKANLLIVDDDANTLASLARAFRLAGHEATVCDSAVRALELARAQRFDLILSDVVMPSKDGLSFLEDLKNLGVASPVVMISGQANIEMAVRATRLGAVDFLEKPISSDKLLVTVENALKRKRLEEENVELRQRLGKHELIWTSEAMRRVMAQVERIAASETRVCILGETGTGKELIARTLHERSARREAPFVTLNCAAVPAELIESELFGHEKGAFTGAAARHAGKFEQAHGGTLFLDEIGDMPLPMQAKLLRVLEEGEVERVGGDRALRVDVRVLVATHRNLEELARQGSFRQDLFHRVFVFPLQLPPLRERLDDIPVLAAHFAAQIAAQNGWKSRTFASEALAALQQYAWPGNVRELRNVIERVLLLSSDEVDAASVQLALPQLSSAGVGAVFSTASGASSGSLAERVEAFERDVLLAELKRNHHHMTNTARALGLERSHLYKKCQQLGIDLRAIRSDR
ncbi:MAG: sigma-54 dependent transcriptional regulator [Acidobacteria bacterium]|nr:sigma-54 dependent transcriptional regulator [Acidobacteriota bacterium]MCL5288983.1 sigma-54 dependent transcriptional regulator [Acidobacteriota bacterium]